MEELTFLLLAVLCFDAFGAQSGNIENSPKKAGRPGLFMLTSWWYWPNDALYRRGWVNICLV